jgi:hypothetical protein
LSLHTCRSWFIAASNIENNDDIAPRSAREDNLSVGHLPLLDRMPGSIIRASNGRLKVPIGQEPNNGVNVSPYVQVHQEDDALVHQVDALLVAEDTKGHLHVPQADDALVHHDDLLVAEETKGYEVECLNKSTTELTTGTLWR